MRRTRHIDAEGFFHGTQGSAPEPMLAQIAAEAAKERAALRARRILALKRLEARILATTDQIDALENRKSDVIERTRTARPHLLRALGTLGLAGLAIVGEVILLAPVMDGFGIADRGLQELAALVLVLVSSGLVHLLTARVRPAVDGSVRAPQRWTTALVTAGLAVLTFGLLVVLGWWRGSEMLFAAEATGGEWAAFMASAATLTRLCVTLLTVALPIFAAVIGEGACSELLLAWTVLRTERALARASARLHRLTKRREGKEAQLAATLEALTKDEERRHHHYLEHHEVGERLGAAREPFARPMLRCVALAAIAAVACIVLDPLLAPSVAERSSRVALDVLAIVAVGGFYAAYAWRTWERPNPAQLFRVRALRWRDDPTAPTAPPKSDRPRVPVLARAKGSDTR